MEQSDSFSQTKLFQIYKTKMDKYIGEPCYNFKIILSGIFTGETVEEIKI